MEKAERQEAKVVKRKSGATGKRKQADSVGGGDERKEVVALTKRIAQLEAGRAAGPQVSLRFL
jgi:hypothetical protein